MTKRFHGLDIELDDYPRNGVNYIECLIEGKERILTPEEEVRQAVIDYILNSSDIDLSDVVPYVEHNSLDVVFYYTTHLPDFSPSFSPSLIIETKRDFTSLLDWGYQITNYLILNECTKGLLLNSQNIYLYQINGAGKQSPTLINIGDIAGVFSSLIKPFTDLDVAAFEDAVNGSLNAFKFLVGKYGRTSRVTFVCKGLNAPIQNAFCIKFIDNYICFDISGQVSKMKQNRVLASSFDKLVSIR